MSLIPRRRKEPRSQHVELKDSMNQQNREYIIAVLKEKAKYGMLSDFDKGRLAALESGAGQAEQE